MASVFSIGASKITPATFLPRLCKIPKNHNVIQVAFMKRLALCDPVHKPAPFKYWEKFQSPFQMLKTSFVMRYDENTRIIVVDGPPAVGKTKLCEKLAEEFGMLYMPPPGHDELYINPHGYDLREMDSKLPLHAQSYDLERFLANPNDVRVSFFQLLYYLMRFEQYGNAILHVLSTGQGVVLNRCAYSDIVFMEAMLKSGYITKEAMSQYMFMNNKGCKALFRPHLIIYLDVPPELVKEKIKKRGNPHEVNSKVFTTKFLTDLQNAYKEKYLKTLKEHSQLLIYDWSKEGNFNDVIHDIENVDLDTFKKPRLADWIFGSVSDIYDAIRTFQDKVPMILDMYNNLEVPPRELYWTAEECNLIESTMNSIPTEKYDYEFTPGINKNIWFKNDKPELHPLRRTPRDFVNLNKSM